MLSWVEHEKCFITLGPGTEISWVSPYITEISPTGSLVEDPKELERIDSEKRKYEIMREHYKDDWLKALLADQGRLTENKTEDQSMAEDQSIEPEIVTATVKVEEAVNVEPKAEGEIAVQEAVVEKEATTQSSGLFDIHLSNVVYRE